MSGAPHGRYLEVTLGAGDNARTERYYLQPRILSDSTIERMRAVLIKRRREKRRELMQDWAIGAANLPEAAHIAFAKEMIEEARDDVDIDVSQVIDFLNSGDQESLCTLLMCACPDIKTLDHAKEVMAAYGDLQEMFEMIMEIANEEATAEKN